MLLDYMKGHMGGNTIALLLGEQIPEGREIQVAQEALSAPYLACHEAGILYQPREDGHLRVKIVEPGNPDYIAACGGMTQVLGKALVETSLGRHFHIELREPVQEILLETDAGLLKLQVEIREGVATRVLSDLTFFARDCYSTGVYPMTLKGVQVMRVGKFLVVDGDKLKRKFPELDYASLDEDTREVLFALYREYHSQTGLDSYDFSFFDRNSRAGADLRAVFPHNIREGWIEPTCGTGSVALGIALYEESRAPAREGAFRVTLETGGGLNLGGPDLTVLDMTYEGGELTEALFSHSFVQVTSLGQVIIP